MENKGAEPSVILIHLAGSSSTMVLNKLVAFGCNSININPIDIYTKNSQRTPWRPSDFLYKMSINHPMQRLKQ